MSPTGPSVSTGRAHPQWDVHPISAVCTLPYDCRDGTGPERPFEAPAPRMEDRRGHRAVRPWPTCARGGWWRRRLAQRREYLTDRFGPEIARAILGRSVWQGQTEEMLLKSRGAPARVDEDVLKTKVRRNYKCEPRSRGFAMTVKVENGVVVGWEDKR